MAAMPQALKCSTYAVSKHFSLRNLNRAIKSPHPELWTESIFGRLFSEDTLTKNQLQNFTKNKRRRDGKLLKEVSPVINIVTGFSSDLKITSATYNMCLNTPKDINQIVCSTNNYSNYFKKTIDQVDIEENILHFLSEIDLIETSVPYKNLNRFNAFCTFVTCAGVAKMLSEKATPPETAIYRKQSYNGKYNPSFGLNHFNYRSIAPVILPETGTAIANCLSISHPEAIFVAMALTDYPITPEISEGYKKYIAYHGIDAPANQEEYSIVNVPATENPFEMFFKNMSSPKRTNGTTPKP
jgi:hypothetical protein